MLGGIAAFTVVDGADVGVADTGNNFMVEASDVGRKRAAAVAAPLKELNENVAGSCVEEDPMALLEAQPTFFHSFTLVIATQVCNRSPFLEPGPQTCIFACKEFSSTCSFAHSSR